MDLVEEYLRVVALLLPKGQRDDIVAELRDTILSRVEAREAELGRPLTPDETETVLREIGHPLVIAARYREGPQHAVGPALYPYWMFALKAAVTLICAIAAVMFVLRLLGSGDIAWALGSALAPAIGGIVSVVGLATIAAWIIERHGVSIDYLDRWRVRDLKGLEVLAWDFERVREHLARGAAAGPRPPPPWPPGGRAEARAHHREWRQAAREARRHARRPAAERAIGAMVFGAVLILWWIGLLPFGLIGSPAQMRELGIDPGPLASVNWTAVRNMLFAPVLAYAVAVICQGVVLWTRPDAVRLHGLVNLAIAALVVACVAWLWMASPLSPAIHVDSLAGLAVQVRDALDQPPPKPVGPFVALILVCIGFGAMIRALHGLLQLVFGAPGPEPFGVNGHAGP